jgi:hypothetical protein
MPSWRVSHVGRWVFPGLFAGILAITSPGLAQTPPDLDGDETPDATDNCLVGSNPDQANADGDGIGDACDLTPADAQDSGRLVITPKTLNLKSKGRVVTTVIELSPPSIPPGLIPPASSSKAPCRSSCLRPRSSGTAMRMAPLRSWSSSADVTSSACCATPAGTKAPLSSGGQDLPMGSRSKSEGACA